jgi:tryptophanyl-tRNA synthetase
MEQGHGISRLTQYLPHQQQVNQYFAIADFEKCTSYNKPEYITTVMELYN